MTDYSAYQLESGPTDVTADDSAYTMGLEFNVLTDCWLKAIHFWQASGNSPSSATRKALLYRVIDGSSGTELLPATDFPATVSGWNSFTDVGVFPLTIGTYRACVFHPAGRYSATANYYSSGAGSEPVTNGPLRIPDSDTANGADQNSFIANATPQYPSGSFNANKYWIDVTLTDVDPSIPPAPVGPMSIADEARVLMLDALTLDEPRQETNVDLMRLVIAAGGLGLITPNDKTAAVQYWNYLKTVRDS